MGWEGGGALDREGGGAGAAAIYGGRGAPEVSGFCSDYYSSYYLISKKNYSSYYYRITEVVVLVKIYLQETNSSIHIFTSP